jgi:hypothetical protein
MKRLAVACLALIVSCASVWTVAGAQENHGRHNGWRNHNHHGRYNNQCGYQYNQNRDGDNDRDDNENDDNNNNGQYGQYGQYGQNGQYNGQYNGPYAAPGVPRPYATQTQPCGQYGQYGNANAVVRGTIVAVNGNQVIIQGNNGYNNGGYNNGGYNNGGYGGYGYGSTITINDQAALNNQTTGRVQVGRYVTAYGYWQNGVFYATQLV